MAATADIPPDTNYAPLFQIVCGLLLALALSLCVARIVSRLRPSPHLKLDDYLIATAAIISIGSYIAGSINAAHGWGHMSYYVSAHNQKIAFQCLFAQQILWCFATALVRISVACSLLRLGTSRLWRWSLYGMIVLQIVTYLGFLVFLLGHASDIRANWEPVPTATWWDRTYEVTYGWVANGLMIGLDFTLALMPIRLIWTLHRTLREKILICCLMAMGLVATGIAAYKMTLSTKFQKGDLLSATVQLSLWNRLEELVGMSAACMPSLKAPAERFLLHIGVLAKQAGVSRPSFVMSLAEVRPQESQPVDSESQAFDSLQSHEDAYRKETLRTESKDSGSSKEVDISVP